MCIRDRYKSLTEQDLAFTSIICGTFLEDNSSFSSIVELTIVIFLLLIFLSFKNDINSFVFSEEGSFSTTINESFFTLSDKMHLKAKCFVLTLTFFEKVFGDGPKIDPPPLFNGDLLVPCLALPVPFCLNGFLPPPETADLFFVELVPCLKLFNSATTDW